MNELFLYLEDLGCFQFLTIIKHNAVLNILGFLKLYLALDRQTRGWVFKQRESKYTGKKQHSVLREQQIKGRGETSKTYGWRSRGQIIKDILAFSAFSFLH